MGVRSRLAGLFRAESPVEKRSLVTALVVTYNQAHFIEAALDSVKAQVLDAPLEIVVADDCSTDATVDVVRAWAERNEREVRILPSERNVGITKNYQRAFAECRGEFIAVLEGDDEWSAENKLQLLTDELRNDTTLAMAGNHTLMVDEATGESRLLPEGEHATTSRRVTALELTRGNIFHTFSACVYRTSAIRSIRPETFDLLAYDWLVNLSVLLTGDGLLRPEIMTRYRSHAAGVWMSKTDRERDEEVRDLLPGYMALFDSPIRDSLGKMHAALVAQLGPGPE